MEMVVRYCGANRDDFGRHDARRILTEALERTGRRIKKVCLYIEDVNGPRGGTDKHCRCVLHVDRMRPVVIRDRDAGVTSLLHRVANRAARVLRDRIKRRKATRRRTPRSLTD